MKHFLFLLFLIFNLSFFPSLIYAADINIDCPATPGNCSVTGADPLFSSADGLWFPGRLLSKTINLKNSSNSAQTMSLQANRSLLSAVIPSPLEDADIINISLIKPGSFLIWAGDLANFYSAGEIDFGIFPSSAAADYSLAVSMNSSADNNYQDKEAKFDLILGFTTETAPAPGTDGIGGGDASPPVCTDPVPATPANLSASSVSSTQVLLSWNHVSAPFTSYLIAFGPAIGDYRWGNPNVGSGNSYTVGSLTPGAQYCFYVRAQNGCMPGQPSVPVCINPGSTISVSEIPPPGFQPGVLGEQTEPEPNQTGENGNIIGLTNQCLRHWLPLLWLFALFINFLNYRHQLQKRPSQRSSWFHYYAILTSLITYIIDRCFLKNRCCLIFPPYCHYFYFAHLFSFLLPWYYYHRRVK